MGDTDNQVALKPTCPTRKQDQSSSSPEPTPFTTTASLFPLHTVLPNLSCLWVFWYSAPFYIAWPSLLNLDSLPSLLPTDLKVSMVVHTHSNPRTQGLTQGKCKSDVHMGRRKESSQTKQNKTKQEVSSDSETPLIASSLYRHLLILLVSVSFYLDVNIM